MSLSPDELMDLYRETVADHARRPRNFREMPQASHRAEGHNRSCGDRVTLWLQLEGDVIRDASFTGSGCSISTSSASLLTEAIKDKTIDETERLFSRFHEMVTAGVEQPIDDESLGKLVVFGGVRKFPIRVKCATLAWHTMRSALGVSEREDQKTLTRNGHE